MATMKAIKVCEGKTIEITEVPIPKVRDEWVLVKVKAVACNPTDWKHIDQGDADPGAGLGCDYSGIVEEIGSKVTKFKKGDRIAGFSHGGNRVDHETGAYAEYLITKACIQIKLPDNLSFEEGATLGVAMLTCGQGLYKSLQLPLPTAPAKTPFPILIHGGSTAMGVSGIQYAKASGLTVIATSSPSNFDYLKSLGVDAVFDYKSPTCAADIKEFTKNKLRYAWDCAGGGEALCGEVLSNTEPSKYGAINMPNNKLLKKTNPLVEGPLITLAYVVLGESFKYGGMDWPRQADEQEYGSMFVELSRKLFAEGTIRPIRTTVNRAGRGLEGVMLGIDELRAGRVSGTKLVYTL